MDYSVSTAKDNSYITFNSGETFAERLNDSRLLASGLTIGQQMEQELHEKLQSFIEANRAK